MYKFKFKQFNSTTYLHLIDPMNKYDSNTYMVKVQKKEILKEWMDKYMIMEYGEQDAI